MAGKNKEEEGETPIEGVWLQKDPSGEAEF